MTDTTSFSAQASARVDPQSAAPADNRASYVESGPSLFWLALRLVALTVATLGIYRFWMTTHLRRHYWSAVRVDGDPFEYSGTGLEKLLGFLIALIILAIYLGIVNLGLAFVGLFSTEDPVLLQLTLQLSLLATLPLLFFAAYRARRYVLARTRWRGIRFGVENAAWAYTGRAMLLSLLTVITLGLMYPYQHFKMEKFKIDRTWFGDLRFAQGGSWGQLFKYWVWFYVLIAAMGAVGAAMVSSSGAAVALIPILLLLGYGAIAIIGIRYQVASFRYLWGHRTLGGASFRNDISTGEVIGIYIGGGLATLICASIASAALLGLLALIAYGTLGESVFSQILDFNAMSESQSLAAGRWVALAGTAISYISLILFSLAFAQVFITRPILRRKAEGMEITNLAAIASSHQRAHDAAAEAGGFADALGVDVGAGF